MTNSCVKGKVGERELAKFFRDNGFDARRGQQYEGSSDSPDIVSKMMAEYGFHIEAKRVEAGNPYKWLEQARNDAGEKTPIVAHRRNRHGWIAVLDLGALLQLIRKANG